MLFNNHPAKTFLSISCMGSFQTPLHGMPSLHHGEACRMERCCDLAGSPRPYKVLPCWTRCGPWYWHMETKPPSANREGWAGHNTILTLERKKWAMSSRPALAHQGGGNKNVRQCHFSLKLIDPDLTKKMFIIKNGKEWFMFRNR